MHTTGGLFFFLRDEQGELFHQRNREVSGIGRSAGQDGHIVEFGAAFRFDGRSRRGRNETCTRLGSREGGFEIQHRLKWGAIGEHFFPGWGAKQGVKQVHALSVITPARERKRFPWWLAREINGGVRAGDSVQIRMPAGSAN